MNNPTFFRKSRGQMAGTDLTPQKPGQLPETDKWTGDYLANSPSFNSWIKSNAKTLAEYDGGELENALKKL